MPEEKKIGKNKAKYKAMCDFLYLELMGGCKCKGIHTHKSFYPIFVKIMSEEIKKSFDETTSEEKNKKCCRG